MPDGFEGADEYAKQQQMALMRAIAQSGSQGKAMFREQAGQIDQSRQQAIDSALSRSQIAAAPASLQAKLAGQAAMPGNQRAADNDAAMRTSSESFGILSGGADQYMNRLRAAIPIVQSRTTATVAGIKAERDKQEAENALRRQQLELGLQSDREERDARLREMAIEEQLGRMGITKAELGLEGDKLGLEGNRIGLEGARLGLEGDRLSLQQQREERRAGKPKSIEERKFEQAQKRKAAQSMVRSQMAKSASPSTISAFNTLVAHNPSLEAALADIDLGRRTPAVDAEGYPVVDEKGNPIKGLSQFEADFGKMSDKALRDWLRRYYQANLGGEQRAKAGVGNKPKPKLGSFAGAKAKGSAKAKPKPKK